MNIWLNLCTQTYTHKPHFQGIKIAYKAIIVCSAMAIYKCTCLILKIFICVPYHLRESEK